MVSIKKVFVEKKEGYNVEAIQLLKDFKENLNIMGLTGVRVINYYQIDNISDEEFKKAVVTVFSEPNVDYVYFEQFPVNDGDYTFRVEFLPGQYNQRADSATQCLEILTGKKGYNVNSSKIVILEGDITDEEIKRIKEYYINPVESREVAIDQITLYTELEEPANVEIINGFIDMSKEELESFRNEIGFAMDFEDILFCQEYFKNEERRDPTITELKVIDTYWSDHCRHTTFMTSIENIEIEEGQYKKIFEETLKKYFESREYVHEAKEKPVCLMDMGTIMAKEMSKKGVLDDLEKSDEINACSIEIDVDVNGKIEKWLLMFKNETHNHPTEIEPFGGAATCLGGAIRDPLSGRSYVYQAMRVTGSGDPRTSIEETLQGKLPQRKITLGAMKGYSSYGNQIGLATGYVREIYDEGYIAKRMEVGAVVGAGLKENVIRETPQPGDLVLLVGGRTGRDGLGGAVGSSKEHDESSLLTCGSEVQKGNPPIERKILRLFRSPKVSKMIKRCNDFGAGGVSVAIGELADGLNIELDKVPKKYEGLDGTEIALSESQERMAVVIDSKDVDTFVKYCEEENVEVTIVANVTSEKRLVMNWREDEIVNISRDFLDTNGVRKKTRVFVEEPKGNNYFDLLPKELEKSKDIKDAWISNMTDINTCSQRGLMEKFDNTIGAGTVLMPFGGKYKQTPIDGMIGKIPVYEGETDTCSMMTYGFNPKISKWSPFHGGMYAVIESLAKIVAFGGDYRKVRLTFQEYFEKLGEDEKKWGKPFSALLGAYLVQKSLNIPSIGGKDSMSGTFNELNVPPTLISFAVTTGKASKVVSPEFKGKRNTVVLVPLTIDENGMPDFEELDKNYTRIFNLIEDGRILSATSVKEGGIARSISEMSFGNRIGFTFGKEIDSKVFAPIYGSIILEISSDEDVKELFEGIDIEILGSTNDGDYIEANGEKISLNELVGEWEKPLKDVFSLKEDVDGKPIEICYGKGVKRTSKIKIAKPRVFIPVFPGTNCELDTKIAFERAGGVVDTFVFRNLAGEDIEYSIKEMVKHINNSQIIAIPGGFSGGDEPDGSGKFIATVFKNPYISEAVMELLKNRDGLMLGICNGFQALIKLGLVPFGEIRDMEDDSPTLTFNRIGCHVSTIVKTKVVSNLSPWFNNVKVGDIHTVPISHGEGRFVANKETMDRLIANGQVATQYVDFDGKPSYDGYFNPNGSIEAVEAITSPDGRVLGKMGHSERMGNNIIKNIPGNKDQKIFEAGIRYFI
ncbi:phosphoribosylformylglycinamidine synthase [Anaerosalibacter sp. Marseille-P3206]|uniref:phosphoribosylformylglycinamidine synthase n=1 Tax=Anaerosalibacter sp. Marseille-P3206 TaxID=1871005 RepID=UPI00098677ED|nr:phosphoribosylformylglycinamidine synthase [Anaerosalibacter sp. Marseille-P3206]